MKKEFLVLASVVLSVMVFGGMVMAATATAPPVTAAVTVPGYLSLTLTTGDYVNFGILVPGTSNSLATNNPLTIHVGAESNVDVKISTKANDLLFKDGKTGTPNSFSIGNMAFSLSSAIPGSWTAYQGVVESQEVCNPISAGGDCVMYHKISIDPKQSASVTNPYSVGITITGDSL